MIVTTGAVRWASNGCSPADDRGGSSSGRWGAASPGPHLPGCWPSTASAPPARAGGPPRRDLDGPRPDMFPGTARNVIFLMMNGGPSQVDTFDFKPALEKYAGQPLPPDKKFINSGGRKMGYLTPPFASSGPGARAA